MSEPEPVRDEFEDDDDFAVWPFRRQLVDPLSRGHEPVVVTPPTPRPRKHDTQEFMPLWASPAPRRSSAPARLAIPLALAVFFAAIAGAAAIANRDHVRSELKAQIQPAAAKAAPTKAKVKARPAPAPARRKTEPTLFVPDVVGLARKAAVKELKLKKFHVRVRFAKGAPDTVIEQTPRAATEVRRAGRVLLVVGREQPKRKPKPEHAAAPQAPAAAPTPMPRVIVAGVVGLSRADAARSLANEGLTPGVYEVPSSEPPGTVVAQAPAGGTRVVSGSPVRINVAAGR